jgi:hypothetical protein
MKTSVGSIPSEDGFCRLETKHDRKIVRRSELFVLARKFWEQRLPCQEICPGFEYQ